jgi:hypothetical protein
MRDSITITQTELKKIARLADFADWYLDGMETSNEAYKSDRDDILEAHAVLQDLWALFNTVS